MNTSTDITPFQFDGRTIRIIDKDGELWFVAGDVAAELGYDEAYQLTRLLDDDEKVPHIVGTLGGDQEVTLISEPGLYRAIIQRRARKSADERLLKRVTRFQRWVFHDVLPSIRKTGSYAIDRPAPEFKLPQTFAEALRLAAEQSERLEAQAVVIAEMAPKAEFHDDVASAVNAQTFMDVAKFMGTGRTRFTQWLRERRFLMENNRPYQSYLDAGYFRVVEKKRKDPITGEVFTYPQTLICGKGVTYLQKKWSEDHPNSDGNLKTA